MMEALYSFPVLQTPIYLILWSFLVYAFLGVVVEAVFCLVHDHVLESRVGLLYLPLRPVYGIGGVACALLLQQHRHQPVALFLLGALICSVVEYVSSFVTEKVFGTVSWDYSDKVLNLHGRICVQFSACFGLLAVATLYGIDPLVRGTLDLLDRRVVEAVLTAIMGLVLLSTALTIAALKRIRRRIDDLEGHRRETGRNVTDTVWDRLVERLAPDAVMIKTFPQMGLMTQLATVTVHRQALIGS